MGNVLVELGMTWLLGAAIGSQLLSYETFPPTPLALAGMVLVCAILSTFYFGKMSWFFVGVMGFLQGTLVLAYPLGGILLGACMVGAGMYGKALGEMGLVDYFAHGKTRLPAMSLAALLNLLLIIAFALLLAFVWKALPSATQLGLFIPLKGLGV
jgi:hypothetical protein